MRPHERLRQLIEIEEDRLRAGIPVDREAAVVALVGALDRLIPDRHADPRPDVITGHRLPAPGAGTALRLCLEAIPGNAIGTSALPDAALDGWAARSLDDCGRLAEARLVLTHVETGVMRLVEDGAGMVHTWLATRRAPASWLERMDVDWWASSLAASHEAEASALRLELRAAGRLADVRETVRRRLAAVHLQAMSYQLGYPNDAVLGGLPVATWLEVIGELMGMALDDAERGGAPQARSERELAESVATALDIDAGLAGRAVATLALDADGAAWHAAVPGVAAPPLVRTGPDRVVVSRFGLTTEPLFFLARELRRRDADSWHNAAHLREGVFRRDLYALFEDRRYVTSAGRIVLRREDRRVRTDIDAAVFDRRTGTLGLFELKSQDPFARSPAELIRQRDNVLAANRQVGGVLDWLNRHGGDEILSRFDRQSARTFRVRKVCPFVLGRYLVHVGGGPEPDRRAAWGTWPQVLRLAGSQTLSGKDGNPIASLFASLKGDAATWPTGELTSRTLGIGGGQVVVHPSYGAYQEFEAAVRGSAG